MTEAPSSSRRPKNGALETLIATFSVFRDYRPLGIGIHKSIRERLPDIGLDQLRLALKSHTRSTRYLKTLAEGDVRFNLDGAPDGAVTPEQRAQALAELRERYRKRAERHKADQQAKERQKKLLQLADKFNAR